MNPIRETTFVRNSVWVCIQKTLLTDLEALFIDFLAPLAATLLVDQSEPEFFVEVPGGIQTSKGAKVNAVVALLAAKIYSGF